MNEVRVLVVEDEVVVAHHLKARLEELGYAVAGLAHTGAQCLQLIETTRPDAVLMDICLQGGMDGVEAAQAIRQRLDIPVIYVTGYADEATVDRAKLSEPYGYVTKPFELSDLRGTIRTALYKHAVDKRLREGHAELEQRVKERTAELAKANALLQQEISDHWLTQDGLARRVEELQVLTRLSREVVAGPSVRAVVDAALSTLATQLAPDLILIYLRDANRLVPHGVHASRPGLATAAVEKTVGTCLCGLAACDGKPYYSTDLHADPLCTLDDCKKTGMSSFAALPLRSGSDVLGVLGLASAAPRDFREQAAFLEVLVGQVSLGLHNALLYEDLSARAAQLECEVQERRQAEESLRRGESELRLHRDRLEMLVGERTAELSTVVGRLEAVLADKEVLLRELHHRVKNNLQLVSSILQLQADAQPDGPAGAGLRDSRDRIHSMALVHERLYASPDLSRIDLAAYISQVAAYLVHTYGSECGAVRVHTDVEDMVIGIDVALPCALIVNELVSNSLKHAFPRDGAATPGQGGEIQIRLAARDGWLTLAVADNGIGLPAGSDLDQPKTLGLQLVTLLAQQLGGLPAVDRAGGTTISVRFPAPACVTGG